MQQGFVAESIYKDFCDILASLNKFFNILSSVIFKKIFFLVSFKSSNESLKNIYKQTYTPAYMLNDILAQFSADFGISLWLLILIFVWSAIWKFVALWKSARNNHLIWFVVIAIVNTFGIIEILYIFLFSKINLDKSPSRPRPSAKKR